ncbi:MAG TPA: replication-relaxation family protein [Candidatus Saccharimonadales bacterium]|nr:replication-relaxation family protein [Candidatus Saccharimonadales bacterium]
MTARPTPQRVRAGHVAWVGERLGERDWHILTAVNRLHLLTGLQIERLCFANLTGRSRTVTRARVLSRLIAWRVLQRLPRRIGGAMRGSSVAVYALDTTAQRLLIQRANGSAVPTLVRKASVPSDRFIAHILAVSELAVQLVEAERRGELRLRQFTAEPAAWWPNGQGGWLKPDAFIVVSNGAVDHLYWAEADRATESLATIGRKLRTYLDFVQRGQVGPRGAIPRVLITVPHLARQAAITGLVARLPPPAEELFRVALDRDATAAICQYLSG